MWVEARQDVRSIHWRLILLWRFLITIWTLELTVLLITLGVMTMAFSGDNEAACTPDGHFSLDPVAYNYWSADSVFQITLAYGEMVSVQTDKSS